MARNNLADIVKVDIEIEEPVTNNTSFNHMLIVGPQPVVRDYTRAKAVRSCYTCTSYEELVGYVKDIVGVKPSFDVADLGEVPVLDAAKVAFAQSPAPSKIYIAFNKFHERSIELCKVDLITNLTKLNNSIGESNVTAELLMNDDKSPEDAGYTFPGMIVVKYKKLGGNDPEATCTVDIGETEYSSGSNPSAMDSTGTSEDGYIFHVLKLSDYVDNSITVTLSRTVAGTTTTFKSEFMLQNGSLGLEYKTDKKESYTIPHVSVDSTIMDALDTNGWYVVCPTYTNPDTLYRLDDIISSLNASPKIMAYSVFGDIEEEIPVEDIVTVTEEVNGEDVVTRVTPYNTNDLVSNKSFRSFGIYAGTYYGQTAEELGITGDRKNKYLHIAWAAECLNNEAGSETWVHKKLIGVQPCNMTSTDMTILKAYNVSYYTTYADRDITQGGKVAAGEWIDVIRFRDWLQNDMQIRVFNTLVKHPKVPYTDEGISLIKNQMIASLKQGQVQGGIAPTEFDEDENEIPGFVVKVPLAANIPDFQKHSRVLKDCTFRARLAGAIHVVEIKGVLAYDLEET